MQAVFGRILFRMLDEASLERSAELLLSGYDFDRWLGEVLGSQEFSLRARQFQAAYLPETGSGLPAGRADDCPALQLRLGRDGPLGVAGSLLLVPNDQAMLTAVRQSEAWNGETLQFMAERVNPSRTYVLVDIGTGAGLVARQALLGHPNLVAAHCIEPDPASAGLLRANLAGLRHAMIHVHEVALGTHAGPVALFRDLADSNWRSLHANAMRSPAFDSITVQSSAAEAFLSRHMAGQEPIVWRSATIGSDEEIVAAVPWPVWRRVEVATLQIRRVRLPPARLVALMERLADIPNRRLGGSAVTIEEIARHLDGADGTMKTLQLWR